MTSSIHIFRTSFSGSKQPIQGQDQAEIMEHKISEEEICRECARHHLDGMAPVIWQQKYGAGLFQYHFTSHVFFAKPASPRLTLPDCLGNRHWTPRGFVTPTPPLSARILPLFAAFAAHSRLTQARCRPRPVCPNCLNMGFFNMCVMTPTRWWQNSPR